MKKLIVYQLPGRTLLFLLFALAVLPYFCVLEARSQNNASHSIKSLKLQGIHAEDSDDLKQAEAAYASALAEAKRLDAKEDVIEIISRLVRVKIQNHKLAETGSLVKQAIDIVNTLRNPPVIKPSTWDSIVAVFQKPKEPEKYTADMGIWMNAMADGFYEEGSHTTDRSVKEYCLERYVECKLPVEDHFDSQLMSKVCVLTTDLSHQGRYQECLPYEESLVNYIERTKWGTKEFLAGAYSGLAGAYLAAHNPAKAEEAMNRSLQIDEKQRQEKWTQATFARNLGTARLEQGNREAARALYRQAITLHEQSIGTIAVHTGWDKIALGLLEERSGNADEAAKLFRESLDCFEKCPLPEINAINKALHPDGMVYAGRLISAEHLKRYAQSGNDIALVRDLQKKIDSVRALNPHWKTSKNPDPESFYLVWGYIPFAQEIVPTR